MELGCAVQGTRSLQHCSPKGLVVLELVPKRPPELRSGGPPPTLAPSEPSRAARIFPTLGEGEIRRVAAHGRRRETRPGETLVEVGDTNAPFFVLKGLLEVGDVRCRNVKRVASAVGEGSIAIALVHQALRQ